MSHKFKKHTNKHHRYKTNNAQKSAKEKRVGSQVVWFLTADNITFMVSLKKAQLLRMNPFYQ